MSASAKPALWRRILAIPVWAAVGIGAVLTAAFYALWIYVLVVGGGILLWQWLFS